MFYVIGELVGCIFWGILIALAISGFLFYLPRLLNPNYSFSPLTILGIVFIFLFLGFQSTLLVGGIKVKSFLPSAKQIMELLPKSQTDKISLTTFENMSQELIADYPMLTSFIEKASDGIKSTDSTLTSLSDIAGYYSNRIHSLVNKYIFRRIAWMLGGIIILTIFLIKDSSKQTNQRRRVASTRRRMPD